MISATHFDHVVTVWGSQETRGSTFREATRSWQKVPGEDRVGMAIQARRETRSDEGPGERVAGEYKGFASAAMNVTEGDVIEIHSGPEASASGPTRKLKADSVYRPRGHHTELTLVQWDGEL